MDSVGFAEALNPLRIFQGLTANQEAYALARFGGATQAEAYREAYGAENMSAETIRHKAGDLDRHPAIVARIGQLTASRMKHSSLLDMLGPEFVTDGLMRLSMTAEKESVKLGALIALGKVAGIDLFRETTRIEKVDRTPEDVDKELKAKLQAMMQSMTIDGEARPVDNSSSGSAPAKPQPAPTRDRRRKPAPK